jgi:hypothetical protein
MKLKKEKTENHVKKKIRWIILTTVIMIFGLILFKYIPMYIYGNNILYDASSHIIWTSWGLYVLWLLISPKRFWKAIYFIIAGAVIVIMAIQRINVGAHNILGVVLGLAIAAIAIEIPRWNEFSGGVKF